MLALKCIARSNYFHILIKLYVVTNYIKCNSPSENVSSQETLTKFQLNSHFQMEIFVWGLFAFLPCSEPHLLIFLIIPIDVALTI